MRAYSRPRKFDYNVVVIGAGSGGLVSAYIAAAVRAKVALIEKHKMGGDCLNTGCVPSKALIRSAAMLHYASRAKEWGFERTDVEFDFAAVMERVQTVVRKVEPHDSAERYAKLGVDVFEGKAHIVDPYRIEVNGRSFTTRAIIIATGASPFVPSIPGIEKARPLTSDTLWEIRTLPLRLVVVGGGPIGCELAQAFSRFGSRVTLIETLPRILTSEDEDVSHLVRRRLEKEKITLLTGHTLTALDSLNGTKFVICENEKGEGRIECDEILMALGRKANVKGFGLEDLKIRIRDNGTVNVDKFLRTNYPNIYAVGDVTGPYQFTHIASHQAWYASVNGLFSPFKKFRVDYGAVPWTIFTDPEVARVGLNEDEARHRGIRYEVARYDLGELDRAIVDGDDYGMVKVLTPPGKDRILGVSIVGARAGEMLAEFVMAMKHGIGLNKILGTVHAYPTLGEANKYTAGRWKQANRPERVLRFLKRFHGWRRSVAKTRLVYAFLMLAVAILVAGGALVVRSVASPRQAIEPKSPPSEVAGVNRD